MDKEMEKELYVAAMNGDLEFLQRQAEAQNEEMFSQKSGNGNNLIHIAAQYEKVEFIEASLEKSYPKYYKSLIREGNFKEDTPLHVAARVGNFEIVKLLYGYLEKSKGDDEKPWMVQNSDGNTAVHLALLNDNVKIARFLLDKHLDFARVVNKSKEAPLHLAIRQHVVNYSENGTTMAKIQKVIKGRAELMIERAADGENMSSMILFLVENASSVATLPDAEGLTPLHRAASLSSPYNILVTKFIIEHFPESAEVCDASGKSIVHHLVNNKVPTFRDGRFLLQLKEIYALRNHQDQHGNTPLHIAALKKDAIMLQVLLESSTKLNINNRDDISVLSMIQQHNVLQMLEERRMTTEESDKADEANISFLRNRIDTLGIDFLLSRDSKGRNVLHKLMHIKNGSRIVYDNYVDFVKEVLEMLPALVSQIDKEGNTPVHILAQNKFETEIYIDSEDYIGHRVLLWYSGLQSALLEICYRYIIKIQLEESKSNGHSRNTPPWLVQNANGNTPLHEAVIAKCKGMALKLLERNKNSASLVNELQETPLHLLAGTVQDFVAPYVRYDLDRLVKAYVTAAKLPDKEGLTPILRAFKTGNLVTGTILCRICPDAAEIFDNYRQIFWHLLIKQSTGTYHVFQLLQEEPLRKLLGFQDMNKNTPLHLAIQYNRFDILQVLFDTWQDECEGRSVEYADQLPLLIDEPSPHRARYHRELSKDKCWWLPNKGRNRKHEHQWLVKLLYIPNIVGKTPADLIAESTSLPPQLERCLVTNRRLRGLRSSWGIPRSQLQNYMNSMNIIAALETTITFTAAFTVPGGLNQEIGTPILIQTIAFQIFIISDVIAMCLSMMVLICLLWMAATDNRKSIMIQDFAILLLLASFVATIVTFMAGVFATIFPDKPRIAIATLVLCSSLILLVPRSMVTNMLLPFKNVIGNYVRMLSDQAIYIAKKFYT